MTELTVDLIMRSPAPAVPRGTPLTEVVARLRHHNLTGLPVIDTAGRVQGFVSERDCLVPLLVSSYHCEGEPRVDEVMTPARTVTADTSIVTLAQAMSDGEQLRVYPVVAGGKLVGLVTRGDVLAALAASRLSCSRPSRAA